MHSRRKRSHSVQLGTLLKQLPALLSCRRGNRTRQPLLSGLRRIADVYSRARSCSMRGGRVLVSTSAQRLSDVQVPRNRPRPLPRRYIGGNQGNSSVRHSASLADNSSIVAATATMRGWCFAAGSFSLGSTRAVPGSDRVMDCRGEYSRWDTQHRANRLHFEWNHLP